MSKKNQSTKELSERFVLAVVSRDRVGIVRDVTAALKPLKANVERVSQTVVMNYFTLTLVVTFPSLHSPQAIADLLRAAGASGEFEVSVKAFEPSADKQPVVSEADNFVLTLSGPDQPGIIGQIAAYLSGKGINIIDLYAYKPDTKGFMLISQLSVPRHMNAPQIQIDIVALGRKTGLAVTLQHENIFKATNDITAPANFFQ